VEEVTDDTIETYLRPLVRSKQHTRNLERFVNAFDCRHTVQIEKQLRLVQAPTLIAWGTDDVYFELKWSRWLADAIPGTRKRVEFPSARIFFPEERPQQFNKELSEHWAASSGA